MQNKISVIVLNYNGLHFLKTCLRSIFSQTYKNIEVIVTDNHSTDGSLEYLRSLKRIKVIKNSKNYGYAKANNLGARNASGQFLFFLNNDTRLFPNTVEVLVKNYRENHILAAQQIHPQNKKKGGICGVGIDIFGYPTGDDIFKKTKAFFADGAAIFVKKKDFIDIGMFDEKLFIFEEDIDFAWRGQIMGFKIFPCWPAKLIHYCGQTLIHGRSKENNRYFTSYLRRYLNERNVIRNIIKNYSFPFLVFILPTLLIIHLFEITILFFMGKLKVVSCYLRAYQWNLLNLKDTLKMRRFVQKRRKVTDLTLVKRMYFEYAKFKMLLKLGVPVFK